MSTPLVARGDLSSLLSYALSRSDSDSSSSSDLMEEAEAEAVIRMHIDELPKDLKLCARNLCLRKEPYMKVECDEGEEVPAYLFDSPESVDNIQYTPEGEIEGISFYKLVELMTGSQGELVNVFLSTYPTYATEEEVLAALAERMHVPEPLLASSSERRSFRQFVHTKMNHKLASIMKTWAKLRPELFQPESPFLERVKAVLPELEEAKSLNSSTISTAPLPTMRVATRDRLVFSETRVPPTPILPPELDFRGNMLLSWDTVEIARQCTLIEWTYLSRIGVAECLGRKWDKEGKERNAPNIVAMSKRFACARALFIHAIVTADKDNRVKLIKRLLEVAHTCMSTFFNFETPFIISSVMKSDAILALKKAMAQIVSKTHRDIQKRHAAIYTSDFAPVRQEMQRQCNIPCWLALRQELAKIDILHPDFTPTGLINLQKHKMTADVISRLSQYQSSPVQCFKVGMLYDYLEAKNFTIDEMKLTRTAEETDSM